MRLLSIKALAAGFAFAGVLSAAAAQEVTGAGATFPAPLYAKWADAYNKATGVRINYQSVGSGAGLRQIRGKTVDFGASDMPLTDEELAKGRPDTVSDRYRRRGACVQYPRDRDAPDEAEWPGPRRYLSRQDHQVERSGDRRAESRREAARCADLAGAARRRIGHDLHFHQLSFEDEPGLEVEGRRGHGGQLAGGRRWQGQRGRLGIRAAPAELDRLRRICIREAEQDDLCADAELRRRIRRAGGHFLQGGRRRCGLVEDRSTRS